jgi:hypothetical protein
MVLANPTCSMSWSILCWHLLLAVSAFKQHSCQMCRVGQNCIYNIYIYTPYIYRYIYMWFWTTLQMLAGFRFKWQVAFAQGPCHRNEQKVTPECAHVCDDDSCVLDPSLKCAHVCDDDSCVRDPSLECAHACDDDSCVRDPSIECARACDDDTWDSS